MTTMVEEIAAALEAQFPTWLYRPSNAPTGQVGTLYLSDMPDDPDNAVAIYQYPGSPPNRNLGNTTDYEKPRLQVMVRNTDANTANQQSYTIMNYLKTLTGSTLSGVRYINVFPVSSPGELGPDSKLRQRWTANYEIWRAW